MIVAAAVCPPAPLLVPGLADGLAADAAALSAACDQAAAALRQADRVVILSAGPGAAAGTVLAPGDHVTAAGLARSDRRMCVDLWLPGGGSPRTAAASDHTPAIAVGAAVGAHLLARAGVTASTWALHLPAEAGPTVTAPGRIGLLVMADGAACHGDHAPGAPDPRSEAFDAGLVTALRTGDPARLAAYCDEQADLAVALRASTLPALAAMAALTAGAGRAQAEVLHYSVPFGVGYPVAVWQWG